MSVTATDTASTDTLHVYVNANVTTEGGVLHHGVLAWRGAQIVGVAPTMPAEWREGEVEDLDGHVLLPGMIDPHVHSREPGQTHKESFASMAAAFVKGGVTTVFEMPNSIPPLLKEGQVRQRGMRFAADSAVHVGLWALAVGHPEFDDVEGTLRAGAIGIKVFYGYWFDTVEQRFCYQRPCDIDSGRYLPPVDASRLEAIAERVARSHGVLAVHCEDPAYLGKGEEELTLSGVPAEYARLLANRPAAAEDVAVATVIGIAERTGCRIHIVHLASATALPLIRDAKSRGLPVTAETAPHYWLLSAEQVGALGPASKVNPPIRGRWHQERLARALVDGTIDFLASDHAPHAVEEKGGDILEAPAGISGADSFGVLITDAYLRGVLDTKQFLRVGATGAASLFGLSERKGRLAAGFDADFSIVDPRGTNRFDVKSMWSKAKYSPFEGAELLGVVERVVVGGTLHYSRGHGSTRTTGSQWVTGRGICVP